MYIPGHVRKNPMNISRETCIEVFNVIEGNVGIHQMKYRAKRSHSGYSTENNHVIIVLGLKTQSRD